MSELARKIENDEPLTPTERLAVLWFGESHDDEANALLLLDCVFSRICAADPETLTKCAQELQDQMVEVIGSWLPPTRTIFPTPGER